MTNDTRTPEKNRERSAEARRTRLVGRQAMRSITTDLRCYDCGREPIAQAVGVRRTTEGVVGFAGLATCGRIWLCPVCNAKVMARRALEIGLCIAWVQQQPDYWMVWGSLTVRHNSRSDLGALLEMQRAAWRRVVSSKWWRSASSSGTAPHEHTRACAQPCDRKKDSVLYPIDGRVGYIRAAEITIGANGWHPHFHPLVIVRGTRDQAQQFADRMVSEWVYSVEAEGGEARIEGGQQLTVLPRDAVAFAALGEYVTKQTYDHSALALEMVWAQNKTGANPTRKGRAAKTQPHWALLAEIALGVGNHIEEVDRWQQLEEAVPGHRMISWSRGLRDFAGIAAEATDEEVAAQEVGTADDTVCFITPDGWADLRDQPEALALLLSTLESSGWVGLRVLLDGLGIEYFQLTTQEN